MVATKRRFNPDIAVVASEKRVAKQLASGPVIVAAIDLQQGSESINDAVRETAGRLLASLPSARLACINILKLGFITIDTTLDDQGNNKHVDRLVALRHWAQPLKLDESRLTIHVLEAIDPAGAIIDFVKSNHADHVIIGARQSGGLRHLLGSVCAKIAAEAACTVTVVRPPRQVEPELEPPAAAQVAS